MPARGRGEGRGCPRPDARSRHRAGLSAATGHGRQGAEDGLRRQAGDHPVENAQPIDAERSESTRWIRTPAASRTLSIRLRSHAPSRDERPPPADWRPPPADRRRSGAPPLRPTPRRTASEPEIEGAQTEGLFFLGGEAEEGVAASGLEKGFSTPGPPGGKKSARISSMDGGGLPHEQTRHRC